MFKTALKLFQHTIDLEESVKAEINLGMLKLIDQDLIESTSQMVSDALAAGERVWMTSDLHFQHSNIIGFCDRPFFTVSFMTEALIAQLQKIPNDELIIFVGDMDIGEYVRTVELIRRIPGRKILVTGNHDFASDGKCKLALEKNLFEAVVPFLTWNFENRLVVVR
jgi:calcineurin-like phosphoesterase family protein